MGVLAVLAVAGCTASPPAQDQPAVIVPGKPGEPAKTLPADQAGSAVRKPRYNDADVRYVRMMITHHQQAIEMTGLVATRAAREDLKALASRIADTQGPDTKAMEAWIVKNNAPAHENHEQMPGMANAEQLAALRAAGGPAFDTLFLRLMTTHHQGAIAMATELLQTGSDIFVEEMAQDVIATQQKEIGLMTAMLAA